jgi:hypothetical protein
VHYLVIDGRYGTPIYAFLECDPRGSKGYPDLAVREVSVEQTEAAKGPSMRVAVGCDPHHPDHYREFRTDGAVVRAGFILIEPRYVGETWQEYESAFQPQGGKFQKRPAARKA